MKRFSKTCFESILKLADTHDNEILFHHKHNQLNILQIVSLNSYNFHHLFRPIIIFDIILIDSDTIRKS